MNHDIFRSFQNLYSPDDTASMSDEQVLDSDLEALGIENEEETTEESGDTAEEGTEENIESSEEGSETEESDDTETTEEETEETEEEEEVTEEDTETEELTPNEQATFKDIKEKYPKIFKEFPALARSFGEARQYKEVFPTPEDAKEAYGALNNFQEIANDLQTGNPIKLLTSLADSNPDAVVEFSRNILPVLNKLDEGLFYEATLPVLSHFLKNALAAARNTSDEKYGKNLQMAVQYISHWAFKDTNVPDFGKKRDSQPDPERMRLEKEKAEFQRERFQEAADDVNDELKSNLTKVVGSNLKGVPTLKGQSQYIINKIQADIIKEVDKELVQNEGFIKTQRSLWQRAARTNFRDKAILSRIKSVYLEHSKPLIPRVTKKVLLNAKLIKAKKTVVRPDVVTGSARGVRSPNNNVRNINPKTVNFRETSDMDILDGKVKIRGVK